MLNDTNVFQIALPGRPTHQVGISSVDYRMCVLDRSEVVVLTKHTRHERLGGRMLLSKRRRRIQVLLP